MPASLIVRSRVPLLVVLAAVSVFDPTRVVIFGPFLSAFIYLLGRPRSVRLDVPNGTALALAAWAMASTIWSIRPDLSLRSGLTYLSMAILFIAARDAILRAHCAEVGRDPGTIERTVSFPIVLRDDPADAARAFAAICAHNGTPDAGPVPTLLGPPAAVAAAIRPYVDLGFTTIIVRLPAPYDAETLARIGEVRAALVAGATPAA